LPSNEAFGSARNMNGRTPQFEALKKGYNDSTDLNVVWEEKQPWKTVCFLWYVTPPLTEHRNKRTSVSAIRRLEANSTADSEVCFHSSFIFREGKFYLREFMTNHKKSCMSWACFLFKVLSESLSHPCLC
jgi:hypothetical protein